jgi:DNA ligase-1
VYEIGFEAIAASDRHKSGIALRFPRILRQRTDKTIAQADTVESVQKMLNDYEAR